MPEPDPEDRAPAAEPSESDALTSFHVRRAVEGDVESIAWVVRRFTPLLLAQAAVRLGPALRRWHDPEDVVDDVWAKTLPKLRGIAGGHGRYSPAVAKYLSTTLLYRVKDLYEKHIKGKPRTETDEDQTGTGPMARLPDETTGVVQRLVREERRGAAWSCLSELDPKDREIVVLAGIEQRPHSEIAAISGMTPNAVRIRYHRALKRLRETLPRSAFADLAEDPA